ncbi:MAG: hypothetical protein KAU28_03545, partial [Phycisphaerae bacterium]|nr:hypothetical protein [Phycisphaerae bacterium]
MDSSTDTFTPAAARSRPRGIARLWRWRELRWWQRLSRVAVVAAAVAIIAYATLPWWMPTGVLKQWVADDMARQMGVEVTIDHMSIGWGKGMQITGFTVAAPQGFGGEPLLTVERIHTEFAPLRYLFAKRIEVMEVEQPRLLVIVRADGTTNVTPVTLLEFDVNAEHVTVRDAVATLDLPGRDERTQLN